MKPQRVTGERSVKSLHPETFFNMILSALMIEESKE